MSTKKADIRRPHIPEFDFEDEKNADGVLIHGLHEFANDEADDDWLSDLRVAEGFSDYYLRSFLESVGVDADAAAISLISGKTLSHFTNWYAARLLSTARVGTGYAGDDCCYVGVNFEEEWAPIIYVNMFDALEVVHRNGMGFVADGVGCGSHTAKEHVAGLRKLAERALELADNLQSEINPGAVRPRG